jgi:two-component system, OmpR family, KDP operon response regulator KdpE
MLWRNPRRVPATAALADIAPAGERRCAGAVAGSKRCCGIVVPGGNVARILIVDDDPHYRRYLRDVLERGGHEVVEASSGAEAIELYRQHRPDLSIVDLVLPDINGGKVMQSILQLNNSARLIVLSSRDAFSDTEFVGTLKRLGAIDTLRKSDPLEKLLASVIGALRDIRR